MSHVLRRHRNVRRDLADIFVYLGQTRIDSAHRFLREAEATFQRLAQFPGMGVRYEPDDPLFEDIRVSPVSRFKKYLVFYRPIAGGIEVLRVLHGARDIHGLLADDLEIPGDDQPDETPDPP